VIASACTDTGDQMRSICDEGLAISRTSGPQLLAGDVPRDALSFRITPGALLEGDTLVLQGPSHPACPRARAVQSHVLEMMRTPGAGCGPAPRLRHGVRLMANRRRISLAYRRRRVLIVALPPPGINRPARWGCNMDAPGAKSQPRALS
jgi:hypothetical protein